MEYLQSKDGALLAGCSSPAVCRLKWYQGTADSIRQNLYLIERYMPSHILILSGDHIYKMDYSLFAQFHEEEDADLSVSVLDAYWNANMDLTGVAPHFTVISRGIVVLPKGYYQE